MAVDPHKMRDQSKCEESLRWGASEQGLILVKAYGADEPPRAYSLIDEQTKTIAVTR